MADPVRERQPRIAVPGANLHFANNAAELVNVSVTGALIRLGFRPRIGGEWPLAIDLPRWGQVWLNGRVVRYQLEPVKDSPPAANHSLGLAFVQPSERARTLLAHLCGASSVAAPESDLSRHRQTRHSRLRRFSVSLERQCPECGSTAVTKETDHRYSCDQCGSDFAGFHLGAIRISI